MDDPVARADDARSLRSATIRVSGERLDYLMGLAGELIVIKGQLGLDETVGDDPVKAALAGMLKKSVHDLYECALDMRMTQIAPLFEDTRAAVARLAEDLGKDVDVELEGEDTALDRNLIDALKDPLLHLVRNALDHGIEDRQTRAREGKPQKARLRLRARRVGASVVIDVSDDGRGLSRTRIIEHAVRKNLITANEAARRDNAEIYKIIFLPGFSTAETVTHLSGRGVGMSVVNDVVQGARGSIEIDSSPGFGTKFTILLPLGTVITEGILVRVGTVNYVLPILEVREFIKRSEVHMTHVKGSYGMCDVRGEFIPYAELAGDERAAHVCDRKVPGLIAVLEPNRGKIAIAVDDVLGIRQIVLKPIGSVGIAADSHIVGVAILENGNVGMVINSDLLSHKCFSSSDFGPEQFPAEVATK